MTKLSKPMIKPPVMVRFYGREYGRYGQTTDRETAYNSARKHRAEGKLARVINSHGAYWVYVTKKEKS